MGSIGSSFSSSSSSFQSCFVVVLVLGLVLNAAVFCNGGKTSTFVRKTEKTIDMPLDSDVFRLPPGHNAPEQVSVWLSFENFIYSSRASIRTTPFYCL